jgi:hypothetical protein
MKTNEFEQITVDQTQITELKATTAQLTILKCSMCTPTAQYESIVSIYIFN